MPVQPNLFPESDELRDLRGPLSAATGPDNVSAPPRAAIGPSFAPVWLQRTSLLILVLFCVYLGAIVTVLPWWTAVWDHNLFFTTHPSLWAVLRLAPVRGVISGFGLLDIWIGVSEAVHYRDHRS